MSIRVKYIYSACIITETPDVRILHDPWFTDGIYDGSWYQFPKVRRPLDSIGNVDLIYVSHIHPDHYDPIFLKKYFKKFGAKEILISDHNPNFLEKKMLGDGLKPIVIKEPLNINNTIVDIVPHKTGSLSDIDSAIFVKYTDNEKVHTVLNINDIVIDEGILSSLEGKLNDVDIFLCTYTGAGPFPQTYFTKNSSNLKKEAQNKKEQFFKRYKKITEHVNAKVNIPFAGKYLLGGNLSVLNEFRGVADATEVLKIDKNALVLSDDGGTISTDSLKTEQLRKKPYSKTTLNKRILEISKYPMSYEKLFSKSEIQQLPLKRLLVSASEKALQKSEVDSDFYFCINFFCSEYAVINANKHKKEKIKFVSNYSDLPSPKSIIKIDERYLFGLLTHVYHWNNAEVGSQFFVKRVPNINNPKAQNFLNFLTI
jgi:UDP-MurNAc hydroxylase